MTAKEWLSRAKNIEFEIKAIKEQKMILFTELTKCTIPTDAERVSSSKNNLQEIKRVKYFDLCTLLEKKEIALLAVKTEIINAIDSVPDNILKAILFERYINFKKWFQIAQTVNYDEKYIIKYLHPKALRYIKI